MIKLTDFFQRKRLSVGTILVAVSAILIASYKMGLQESEINILSLHEEIPNLEESIMTLRKENINLKKKLLSLERHYQIQLVANKNLENNLKGLQGHNVELTRDISLYQNLAGSLPGKGVQVNSFQVFSSNIAEKFRYFFVLSNNASKQSMAGSVRMTVWGYYRNKQLKGIQLPEMKFKYRHLQDMTGDFYLPAGFVPEEITLEVKLNQDGKIIRLKFPWAVDDSLVEDKSH